MPKMKFSDIVVVKWPSHEPREMVVVHSFYFWDSAGVGWIVSQGRVIDGISFYRMFWGLVGSPYVGLARRAAVVHDVWCVLRGRPHEQVHRMFLDAMEVDGVPKWRRLVMYQAVKRFGPMWDDQGKDLSWGRRLF